MLFFKKNKNRGFTLIEAVLVIALLGMIGGIGLPIYGMISGSNELDVAENILVSTLRRGVTLSQASLDDSLWGVAVLPGSIVIFKGDSYATRDASFDEVYDISDSLEANGLSEIIFSKMTGIPDKTGSFIFTSAGGESKEISINEKGNVDF